VRMPLPTLADEPDLFARRVLHAYVADPLRRPVGNAHADGGKASLQRSFVPLRQASVRHCEWAAASGDGKDEFDVPQVNLLMTKNAIRPGKPARAQGLTELSAHASMRRRQRPIATAT
jgi:hypothetical protein